MATPFSRPPLYRPFDYQTDAAAIASDAD